MKKLKRIFSFSLLFFILSFNPVMAQSNQAANSNPENKTLPNSFAIHGKLSSELLIFYTKSIENSNFEQFRLKSIPVILKFKNGFLLELLSAKELLVRNKEEQININKYADNIALGYKYPMFEILESGWIIAGVENKNPK
jgi:hypothetical protein